MNYLPVRPLIKCNSDDGAWVIAQKADQRKRFKAIICNLKATEGHNPLNRAKYDDENITNANNFKFSKEFILENCKTVDPDKIAVINVGFKDLQSSEDEFYEFSSVYKIDASSNRLSLDDFITFISLIELNISSNNLRNININPQDFENLEILDLSFNNLCNEDILMLGLLRKLKVLNLTGNNLQTLPLDMAHPYMGDDGKCYRKFENLEELHIEHNQLHSSNFFAALGGLPKLRILKLAHNNFESIPMLKCIKLKTCNKNNQIKNYEIDYEEEEEMEDYQNSFFTKNMELRIPSTLHEVEEEITYRNTIDTKSSNEYSPKILSKEAEIIQGILDEIIDKINFQQSQETKYKELEDETETVNDNYSNYRTESKLNDFEDDEEILEEELIKPEEFTENVEKNYFEKNIENNTQVLLSTENTTTTILEFKENIETLTKESPINEDLNDINQHEKFSEEKETINFNHEKLNIEIHTNQNNNLTENLEDKDNTAQFKQEKILIIQEKENEINPSNENQSEGDYESKSDNIKIIIDKHNSKIENPVKNNQENVYANSSELILSQEENEDRIWNLNEECIISKDNEVETNNVETLETFDEMKWMSLSHDDEENSYYSLVIVNDFMKSSSLSDIIRQLSLSSFNENSPKPFPVLEHLDLSFNQIKSERVLIPVIAWLNLKRLSIFNNPISMKKSQKSSFIKVLLENTFKIKVEWLPPISKEKPNPTIKKSKVRVVDTIPNVALNCKKSNAFHSDLIKTEENELNLPKIMPLPNILKQSCPRLQENNSLELIPEMNKPCDDFGNEVDECQSFKLLGKNKTVLMRALQYKIDHPIIYFERNVDLFDKQNSIQPIKKKTNQIDERKMVKSETIASVLNQQKDRVNQTEISLDKAFSTEFITLNRKNKQEAAIASKALKNMQKKYNQVRLESLNKEY